MCSALQRLLSAVLVCCSLCTLSAHPTSAGELRVGVFAVDATPPVGAPLAYDPMTGVNTPLSCRGIVLAGAGKPIVLCAVDWIGISGAGQTVFREQLAAAVGSDSARIAVHTLHQHDAPRCDFSAEALLAQHGHGGIGFDPLHARKVIEAAAKAAKRALQEAQAVTHVGWGEGEVKEVASNRRILGPDGKVKQTRWTATKDPALRALPAGVIDPQVKLICFYQDEQPLVALTYYACHPQSYYRTGLASIDFPGMARQQRQEATGTMHVHFNGAGGNIGAGKWNDGSPANRQVLADKVERGMQQAWDNVRRTPLDSDDVAWNVAPVLLPVAEHLDANALTALLTAEDTAPGARFAAAKKLAWMRRCEAQDPILIGCLRLGPARILHMPGELFVEYQLAAQQMLPDGFVAMAAYGDYSPGYIGTETAYGEGGYETSARASQTAPGVEQVLQGAMRKLLKP